MGGNVTYSSGAKTERPVCLKVKRSCCCYCFAMLFCVNAVVVVLVSTFMFDAVVVIVATDRSLYTHQLLATAD